MATVREELEVSSYENILIEKKLVKYDAENEELIALTFLPPHPRLVYNWLKVKHEILNQPDNIIQEFWKLVKKIRKRGGLMKPEEADKYKMLFKEVRLTLSPYLAWIEHLSAAEPGTVLHDANRKGLWDEPKITFKHFP